jgi:putative tricarboxylic transport membrane protein
VTDIYSGLLLGFSVALTPINLLFCAIGVLIGTFVGIMPGLGPTATIAMLLPLTFGRSPTTALILLAGIYYGAKYGGAITSILVNLPGESSSVMTCLDGHQMAKQGKGGKAIGIAAIGGFFGGTLSVIGLTLLAPPLAAFALSFGPPEYFALLLMGLTAVAFLAGKSMVKALMMGVFGLMLAMVGNDGIA